MGVVAVTLAAGAGPAQAIVPRVGAWESGSRSEPRVSFDVRGPARSRTVQRVSFPITCKATPGVVDWGSTKFVRMHHGGRFTAYSSDSVIRGRFTAKNRASVTVHTNDGDDCRDTRSYVVLRRGQRIAVRTGRFLSLVAGGPVVFLETSAFGRMVLVEYVNGSMSVVCPDGSQQSTALVIPNDSFVTAPIRSNGEFRISTQAGATMTIAGSFDAGSVAAFVFLSILRPDGTRCRATPQPLVGALAYPLVE